MNIHSDIGVVIVNWNTKQYMLESIASYLANGVQIENIVIVDHGSTDGSDEAVRRIYPNVQICILYENIGYGHAGNCGAQLLQTKYLIIANADVIIPLGTLTCLRQVMIDHPAAALIGCHHRDINGNIRTRFSRTTILRGMFLEIIPNALRGKMRLMEMQYRRSSMVQHVRYVEGAFLFFRHLHFDAVGGFDEGFSFFFEDVDLPIRLLNSNFEVLHVPSVFITHIGGASFSQVPIRHKEEFYQNFLRLYERHAARRAIWMLRGYITWFSIHLFIISALFNIFRNAKIVHKVQSLSAITSIFQNKVLSPAPKKNIMSSVEGEPLVSLVIPTFDRPHCLINFLKKLQFQHYKRFEVIVVDQSPKPSAQIKQTINTMPYSIMVFHSEFPNRSNAKNIGIRYAKGDIVLFCDDDITPSDEMIGIHVKYHFDATIGGVSCRIVESNFPYIRTTDICNVTWYGRMKDGFHSDVSCDIGTLVGGNMSIRRDMLHEIGYFDAIYRGTSIYEEQDISERLKKLGYRIHFTNETTLLHQPQTKGNVDLQHNETAQYYHDFHHNEILFFMKNRSHILLLFVIPFCLLRTIKKSIQFRLSISESYRILYGIVSGIKRYYSSLKL